MAVSVAISAILGYIVTEMAMIDELDFRLIRMLQKDARVSSDVLGGKLNTSPTTVRRRIRDMIKRKILRVVALVDPDYVGFPYSVVFALKVTGPRLDAVLSALDTREEIKWLVASTGRFDVLAFARFRNTDEVTGFLQRYVYAGEGVLTCETFVCLQVKKGRYTQV
ncbi:MAG: Lrp/AsnC family transcriptional regulator [Chloroflexi bacterium]|nr:Lrp/AsnC family transcriptional regulator [Chloroflexota bacterium]